MIVCDRFVYLHLHKTGGSFVNDCLMRFQPGARQIGYHLPRALIPEEARHLPIIGFVRKPWSYYVSWFSFQSGLPRPNALFATMSDGGRLGFEDTITNLLNLGSDERLLDALLPKLPDVYLGHGLNMPRFALEPIRRSGLGFYAYLYRYIYGVDRFDESSLTIGRTETLRTDLLAFLRANGAEHGPEAEAFIREAGARNVSRHGDFRAFYGEALRSLVADRDRDIIQRHAYVF